jgi:hypothetical protein
LKPDLLLLIQYFLSYGDAMVRLMLGITGRESQEEINYDEDD